MGLDIGTTGIKTAIYDFQGKLIVYEYNEYPLICERPGWAEHDPNDWWLAIKKGIYNVIKKSRIDKEKILAISTSSLTASPVLIDKKGNVLCRSPIWMDRRSIDECNILQNRMGKNRLYKLTGRRPDPMFNIYKLMWIKKIMPQILNKTYKVLQAKDYINFKLTNQLATDFSIAATMQAMNLKSLKWEEEIFDTAEISINIMPEIKASTEVLGLVDSKIANELSLSNKTKVVVGGADTTIAALGCGAIEEGDLAVNIGTCSDVTMCSNYPVVDKKMRMGCYPYLAKGSYLTIAGANSSGISLKWFRDQFCEIEKIKARKKRTDTYKILDKLAKEIPPGCEGLIFLPYLSGERSPIFNPKARGIFAGINLKHTKAHFIRSILEGVALSIKDRINVHNELGLKIKKVILVGGGANSKLWRQIVTDMIEIPTYVVKGEDTTGLGAAMLAVVGAEIYSDIKEACKNMVFLGNKCFPIEDNSKVYQEEYSLYKMLYKSNINFFDQLYLSER
jgi:xylulokinase